LLSQDRDRLDEREDRDEVADHRGHSRAEATHGPVEEHEADDRREQNEVRDIEPRGQRPRWYVGIAVFEEAERKEHRGSRETGDRGHADWRTVPRRDRTEDRINAPARCTPE